MKQIIRLLMICLAVVCIACDQTPTEQVAEYSKENFGENFKSADIDLSKVFDFEWDNLYIFPPLTNTVMFQS